MRRHSRTMKRGRKGGNMRPVYTPPVMKTMAAEPKALADQVGDSVSDAMRATQATYIRNRDKVREGTKGIFDNVKNFGSAITQRLGSLFGGRRKLHKRSRRHMKKSSKRHARRTRR